MKHLAIAAALLLGGCSFTDAGQDFVTRVSTMSLADIERAQSLAALNQNVPAQQCWAAIHLVVQGQASYHTPPGPATLFQAGLDITDPNGYLNQQCLALRQQVKERVQLFLGKGATIAASFGL